MEHAKEARNYPSALKSFEPESTMPACVHRLYRVSYFATKSGSKNPIQRVLRDWGLGEACSPIRRSIRENPITVRRGTASTFLRGSFCARASPTTWSRPLPSPGADSRQLGLERTESSVMPNVRAAMEVMIDLRALRHFPVDG